MPEPTNPIVSLGVIHGRHVTGADGHTMVQSPNIARGCFPDTPVPNTDSEYPPFAEPNDSDAQEGS